MRKGNVYVHLIAIFLVVICLLVVSQQSVAQSKPKIAVTSRAVALLVRDLCEADCEVVPMMPSGASEHHWQPSPKDIVRLQSSSAVIGIGLNFDDKITGKISRNIKDPNLVVAIGPGLAPIKQPLPLNTLDPHVWMDPLRMKDSLDVMSLCIKKLLPQSGTKIDERKKSLEKALMALHEKTLVKSKNWNQGLFLMFHDAFQYWAVRYNVKMEAAVSGGTEHEISARVMANLIKKFSGVKVAAIVVEHDDGIAKNLAKALSSRVLTLDESVRDSDRDYVAWFERISARFDTVNER